MVSKIIVLESAQFKKAFRKLHKNQQLDIERAVFEIMSHPSIGEAKVGDLAAIRIHKFRMVNRLTLIAYRYYDDCLKLERILFCRDLER